MDFTSSWVAAFIITGYLIAKFKIIKPTSSMLKFRSVITSKTKGVTENLAKLNYTLDQTGENRDDF